MTSALVLASPGAGLSTFFGLLYTAEVRLGSEAEDEFRFHADRESIRRLEGIYGELGDGRFPESEVDWGRTPLTFLLAFRHHALRRALPSGAPAAGEFAPHRFEIGGLTTDEVDELARHDAVLDGATQRLLRSPIVLPILDASRLPNEGEPVAARLAIDDRRLASGIALVARFLAAERRRRGRRLYPLMIVTKCDRLLAGAARRLGVPPGPPSSWSPDDRAAVGARILHEGFPETERALARAPSTRVVLERPTWYFSEVGTDGLNAARIRRRWKQPAGGWEPDYPFEEYRGLLDRLGDLAERLPPDVAS